MCLGFTPRFHTSVSHLGFTAAYDKPLGFVGREATLDQKGRGAAGLSRRLVSVLLEDPTPLMYQGEIVYRNGRRVLIGLLLASEWPLIGL